MFKVQLYGRGAHGLIEPHDLGLSFATFEDAVQGAEAAANPGECSSGKLTNYRITGASGTVLLDVEVSGSRRRFTHRSECV
ncbi:hypothetical protein MPC4_450015 [Methylocella tundrae]|uniref:Uncharacterized protein n=1 Tax=Methylocella tundrae TaxID=227605 RepID=A0A8B6M9S8_METTU|nr:hypothetical protein MPC1_4780007 [Methylocella tundrae]VTZ51674.1 hypothetical protein MPC4_450015 [Methylocella tundrae]